ncbi:unnamed protein product [Lota lota]
MQVTMDDHRQQGASLWDGFMGSSKHTPSLAQVEQLLGRCSGLIYLGTERFMANIPPVKLAAMDLSECHLALIFDLLQNSASAARQSHLDLQKSAGQLTLERPVETAVLLSLCGVRCVVLHQWHSTPRTHALNMAALLDGLLAAGLPSGQALHSLRKGDRGPCGAPESNDSVGAGLVSARIICCLWTSAFISPTPTHCEFPNVGRHHCGPETVGQVGLIDVARVKRQRRTRAASEFKARAVSVALERSPDLLEHFL